MTRDSGSGPTGRDVKQARGEAPQSGHEVASPEPHRNPSSTPPLEKPWPFFGYAPGNYMGTCDNCGEVKSDLDKRAISCLECAVLRAKAYMNAARSNQEATPLDTVMLGRFVAQYDEGAAGFFIDADEAQEVALQVKAALSLGKVIMDEIHTDLSIPTDAACKIYAAIKRASAKPVQEATRTVGDAEIEVAARALYDHEWGNAGSDVGFTADGDYWFSAARVVIDALSHTSSSGGR